MCEGNSPLGYWQKVNQSPAQTKPMTPAFQGRTITLAYLVREHNKTSQTRKIREIRTKYITADRSSEECDARSERIGYKNNIRAKKEQITAARAKQHEDEEEDTSTRPKIKNDKSFE